MSERLFPRDEDEEDDEETSASIGVCGNATGGYVYNAAEPANGAVLYELGEGKNGSAVAPRGLNGGRVLIDACRVVALLGVVAALPGRRARAGGGRRPPRRTARVQPSFRRPYRGAGVGAVSLKTRRSAARRGTAERRGGGRGIAGSDEEVGGQIRGSKTAITRPRSMWSRCTRRTRNIGPVFLYQSTPPCTNWPTHHTHIYRCINLLLNLL